MKKKHNIKEQDTKQVSDMRKYKYSLIIDEVSDYIDSYLKDLGYTKIDNGIKGGNYTYTLRNGKFFHIEKRINVENTKIIDCGSNEQLFLAAAAMSDNTDYMQWFVCTTGYEEIGKNIEYVCYKEGDFSLYTLKENFRGKHWRKATLEELINHFKKSAIELIEEERKRQIEKGYDSKHDEKHFMGELADAASCYAMTPDTRPTELSPFPWPWMGGWNPTPDNRIKELTKAGALIVAEIERLQKLE